jgi:hypothetical protein
MTSPTLKLLERKMLRRQTPEQAPAPEDGLGLGFAIEKFISDEVSRRVGEAEERARQQHLLDRQFNKPVLRTFEQLPPVPRTQPPKAMEFTFQRDELRRIAVISVDGEQWRVQRGAHGEIVRMVPIDTAPMPPAIEPPELKQARQYDPGTER